MGERSGRRTGKEWRGVLMLTSPRNWAVIRLLADGKGRKAIGMASELKGHYNQASVFNAARELAAAGFLMPVHITKEKGGVTVGYALNPKLKGVIALLEKAERDLKKP